EKGRLDAARRHVPALLLHGLRRGSWRSIDGAIELMIPPFTIFAGIMLVLVGLSLFSGSAPLIVVAAAGLIALGLYTLRGLSLASARNPRIYRALLHLPGFVAWRLWTYLGMLARRGRVQWTRTDRTPTR
ncbi:MAG TPA: glycosyl transferase, partial [Chloroflexia bacterium]|nr:glycosyl transferase [Chloroflexia bacterium]